MVETTVRRRPGWALFALWPVGLLLALANAEIPIVTTPVFAVLAAAYVAAAVAVIRSAGRAAPWPSTVLVAAPVVLFVGAGYTGEPTADEPVLLLINTAVLFAVAVALLVAVVESAWRSRAAPDASGAMPAIVLLVAGTTGFLLNLSARTAIVLAGAYAQQRAVEDLHWSAAQYLRGLPGPADFVGYTLVWLDLVQIAYVVSTYVGVAGLARLATAASTVSPRVGKVVVRSAFGAAITSVLCVFAAVALPRAVDAVPATIAFVLTIPFMATVIPAALGAAMIASAAKPSRTYQESK